MRRYIAGVVESGLDFLCHLFAHRPLPCFWSNNRLYWWAWNINHPDAQTGEIRQPFCQRDVDWGTIDGTVTVSSSGSTTTVWLRPPLA